MATQNEMKVVLAKASSDKTFRNALLSDPKKAAGTLNITLDSKQINSLKNAKSLIKASGVAVDKTIEKAAKLLAIWV